MPTREADSAKPASVGHRNRLVVLREGCFADNGCIEVGYGLASSARGNGCAAEALAALLDLAATHGLSRVVAETTGDNVASRRTLEHAGFRHTGTNDDFFQYEVIFGAPQRPSPAR